MLQRIAVYLVLIGYPAFVITPELQALPRPFGPGGGGPQTSTQTSTLKRRLPKRRRNRNQRRGKKLRFQSWYPGGLPPCPWQAEIPLLGPHRQRHGRKPNSKHISRTR